MAFNGKVAPAVVGEEDGATPSSARRSAARVVFASKKKLPTGAKKAGRPNSLASRRRVEQEQPTPLSHSIPNIPRDGSAVRRRVFKANTDEQSTKSVGSLKGPGAIRRTEKSDDQSHGVKRAAAVAVEMDEVPPNVPQTEEKSEPNVAATGHQQMTIPEIELPPARSSPEPANAEKVRQRMMPFASSTDELSAQGGSSSSISVMEDPHFLGSSMGSSRLVSPACPSVESSTFHLLSPFNGNGSSSDNSRRPSMESNLSFVMRERLHHLAKDLNRRTQDMKEHIQRPQTPDDKESLCSVAFEDDEALTALRKRSISSFVGLNETNSGRSSAASVAPPADDKPMNRWQKFRWKVGRRRFFATSYDRQSKKYLVWLAVVMSSFVYNAFAIPLRSSYPYQTEENWLYWAVCDYLCDAVYLVDLLLVKPKMRFMRGGLPVKDGSELRRRYCRSIHFKFDALSLLPTDLLYVKFGFKPYIRAPRILKFMAYPEFFNLLDNRMSNPTTLRIARTLTYMIYIIHCNSCVYYTLSAWQAFGEIGYMAGGVWHANRWVYKNETGPGTFGNVSAYIRCFYFTTKLATSIGNNPQPTNVVEYIYVSISWMMGVFVFAILLGQIRDIVTNADRNREQFRKRLDAAMQQCKQLKLSNEIRNRVRDWFLYTWQEQKTLDENRLVEKLPLKLQTDLAISVHYQTLSKVQLFQDCERALLRDLVLKLRPTLFLPGEYICEKGEVGKEMYIVNKGILEVVGPEGQIFATMQKGSVFGEISLLAIGGGNRRTASVRSKGYSNLFVLSKDDLNEALKDYPDAQRLMKRKARKMLKKDDEVKKKANNEKEDLERIVTISSKLNTPKMLVTVVQAMKDRTQSQTSKTLAKIKESIEEEEYRKELEEMKREIDGDLDDDPMESDLQLNRSQAMLSKASLPSRSSLAGRSASSVPLTSEQDKID